jgi:hypothetical protein
MLLLFKSGHLSDGWIVAPNPVDISQNYGWILGGWVKYLTTRATGLLLSRCGGCGRRGIANCAGGVIGLEGGGVIGVTHDACGQDQVLAFYESGLARKAVDLGNFIPKCALSL